MTVGFENYAYDSNVHVEIEDYSGAGLSVVGADRCRFTGWVRGAVAGSAYGVKAGPGSRGALTQTGNTYSVDVPYDANNSFGFQSQAGLTFTNCVVATCSFVGYPNFSAMFGFAGGFIPTRNVHGRNFAGAVPATGYWAASDIVWNTGTAAGGTPGWVCTTQGAAGTFVFKALANVAA